MINLTCKLYFINNSYEHGPENKELEKKQMKRNLHYLY